MNGLYDWARRWNVPPAAVADLGNYLGLLGPGTMPDGHKGDSEGAAQAAVRLEAAAKNVYLFRNNVGALKREDGVPVRFGLANDSKGANEVMKSSDLIGIRRCSVEQLYFAGVTHVGQFVSREMKEPGWAYRGGSSEQGRREEAQQRWLMLIASQGGDASFATGAGTL